MVTRHSTTGAAAVGAQTPTASLNIQRFLNRYGAAYLFISPFFILYLIFGVYPILYSLALSLHEWHGLGEWNFIGPGNYQSLASDDIFIASLLNTLVYWIGNVPLMISLALIMAAVLNSPSIRFRGFFRTCYILPYVTSSVIIAIVFLNLYDANYGWINYGLRALGLQPIDFVHSTSWSKWSVIILVIWRWVGYNMVIMLAGLQSIPHELYESASIDGANVVQSFLHITVPMMRPIILFTLIMSTIGTLNMFAEPYMLTQGGPANSSISMDLYLFNVAFQYGRFGYAAAVAFAISAIVIVASLIQFKLGSRDD